MEVTIGLAGLIFLAATLYSSVGHAGASGYLAAMALFQLPSDIMKPTALMLNVLVALVATLKFYRAGHFSWPLFLRLAISSAPLAYLGGAISLPGHLYRPAVGVVLLYAAFRLAAGKGCDQKVVHPSLLPVLAAGAAIGFLSGLTGVGGGIFLSPLLLFAGWAKTRQASGISAAFILVNSVAGLLGHYSSVGHLPMQGAVWAPAAILGGWLGSQYGSKWLPTKTIQKLLAIVLAVAAAKMFLVRG